MSIRALLCPFILVGATKFFIMSQYDSPTPLYLDKPLANGRDITLSSTGQLFELEAEKAINEYAVRLDGSPNVLDVTGAREDGPLIMYPPFHTSNQTFVFTLDATTGFYTMSDKNGNCIKVKDPSSGLQAAKCPASADKSFLYKLQTEAERHSPTKPASGYGFPSFGLANGSSPLHLGGLANPFSGWPVGNPHVGMPNNPFSMPNFGDVNMPHFPSLGNMPQLPSLGTMPSLPQMHMPSMPQMHMPSMPQMHMPSMPQMHMPSMPQMHMPSMPQFHMPTWDPITGTFKMPQVPSFGGNGAGSHPGNVTLSKRDLEKLGIGQMIDKIVADRLKDEERDVKTDPKYTRTGQKCGFTKSKTGRPGSHSSGPERDYESAHDSVQLSVSSGSESSPPSMVNPDSQGMLGGPGDYGFPGGLGSPADMGMYPKSPLAPGYAPNFPTGSYPGYMGGGPPPPYEYPASDPVSDLVDVLHACLKNSRSERDDKLASVLDRQAKALDNISNVIKERRAADPVPPVSNLMGHIDSDPVSELGGKENHDSPERVASPPLSEKLDHILSKKPRHKHRPHGTRQKHEVDVPADNVLKKIRAALADSFQNGNKGSKGRKLRSRGRQPDNDIGRDRVKDANRRAERIQAREAAKIKCIIRKLKETKKKSQDDVKEDRTAEFFDAVLDELNVNSTC